MKISELLKTLNDFQNTYGDLDCCVFDPEVNKNGFLDEIPAYIGLSVSDINKKHKVVFMDKETAEALTE